MSERPTEEISFEKFKTTSRRVIRLSQEELIQTRYLDLETRFPLVVEPAVDSLRLAAWARANTDLIQKELLRHGAILFRKFDVSSLSEFQEFATAISPELLDYSERAAPRIEVDKGIYTSTEYPADQYIPLHHEMSYSHNWPTKIWFYCAQPAQHGGRTPIADDRRVFKLLNPKLVQKFVEKKVMYVRNYGEGVDLSWREVFQTEDRAAVMRYCRKTGMQAEWRDNDRLRTRAVRQVVATHPQTGDTVWFNHAHMFHVSNLAPPVREALLAEFKDDELPRNAFYGDGSAIESSVLDEIRETYKGAAISFPWQKGDILMVDNFLASHGREPFVGPRKILVALAELYANPEVSAGMELPT
ncbi:MAG: TauD/TfdA family dioxygenase [Blastocatellia bacterium]